MNYWVDLKFSINNDEEDQEIPTADDIVACIYEGRIAPRLTLINITDLTVEAF